MTSQRFWMVVFLGLGGFGFFVVSRFLTDSDVDALSKVATALVAVLVTALLWQPLEDGAPTIVFSAVGLASIALWGGTTVRAIIGLLVIAVVAMVVTRNRPVHVTTTFSHVLRLPPDAAFDAVMIPHEGLQPQFDVRDTVRLPNGGSSYWLVNRDGQDAHHHVDTEWDRPHCGATDCTAYIDADGVRTETGTASTVTTFRPVRRGTRVTMRQQLHLVQGGLYVNIAWRVLYRRRHRRFYRRAEAAAQASSAAAERIPDADSGPYLQSDS